MIEVKMLEDEELVQFYIGCLQTVYSKYQRYCDNGGSNAINLYTMAIEGVIDVAMNDYRCTPELFERVLAQSTAYKEAMQEVKKELDYCAGNLLADGTEDFYWDTRFATYEEATAWAVEHDCTHICYHKHETGELFYYNVERDLQ